MLVNASGVLSPTPKTIVGTFVPYSSNNILDLAKLVSPVLSGWLRKYISFLTGEDSLEELGSEPLTLPNIIICDYYDTFDFIELIKQINIARYKRSKHQEGVDGILEDFFDVSGNI